MDPDLWLSLVSTLVVLFVVCVVILFVLVLPNYWVPIKSSLSAFFRRLV